MDKIFLVHLKEEAARDLVARLEVLGFKVNYENFSRSVMKKLGETPPDAILIDLDHTPSAGRDIGLGLRKNRATREIPLVFVGGGHSKVDRVRELLPDATYAQWDSIASNLEQAINHPLEDPVVPDSVMAGYAGVPLLRKLGVGEGTQICLVHAPEDFDRTLGQLPRGAAVARELEPDCGITIWFNRSSEQLEGDIQSMVPYAERGGLWIAWPKKTSGVKSDLSQAIVRKVGLDAGLVDFKVCSIDETWSGLRFTKRKESNDRNTISE